MNRLDIDTSKVNVKDGFKMICDSINNLYDIVEKIYELEKLDSTYFASNNDLNLLKDEVNELRTSSFELSKNLSDLQNSLEKCISDLRDNDSTDKELLEKINGIYNQIQVINSSIIAHNDILININKKV